MNAAPRFSLRAAVTDSVSTGRREEPATPPEDDVVPETAPPVSPPPARRRKGRAEAATETTKRPTTRQGARGITVWVEPEVYRMVKLIGLDSDMTTQDVMMEAINDLLAKRGKGRIVKAR